MIHVASASVVHNSSCHTAIRGLVGACLARCTRISATGGDTVSKCVLQSCASFSLLSEHTITVWGPQRPKAYCDNKLFAILSFTSVFTVGVGNVWRQDLAILSPEGSCTAPSNYDTRLQIEARHGKPMSNLLRGPRARGRFAQNGVHTDLLTAQGSSCGFSPINSANTL